jgi:hypothetical protein
VEAAWVAKNCRSSNHREQFVEAVMGAGVRVDNFGGCMHNKDFPAGYQDTEENFMQLLSKYKFYLSFENSICRHYYTEKLFRSLEIGVIPILLGHPADIEYLLPHKVCNYCIGLCVLAVRLGCQLCICEQFSSCMNHQPTAASPFLCAGCSHQGVGFSERSGSRPVRPGGFVQPDSVLQASRLEEQQDARFVPAVRGLLEQTACIW